MRRNRAPSDPKPLWRQVIAQWPEQYRYDFEERAAIKEFLDNQPREQAEREAYEEISLKRMKEGRRG